MPLIVEILTERDLEAYAAGLLDARARRSVEQCARHDRRVAPGCAAAGRTSSRAKPGRSRLAS